MASSISARVASRCVALGSTTRRPAPAPRSVTRSGATKRHTARVPPLRAEPEEAAEAAPSDAQEKSDIEKELERTAQQDGLIDAIMASSTPKEMTKLVAENILSFDQGFWMRVATRADSAGSESEKEALMALARNVMIMVEEMVSQTETQLDDSASVLQGVLTAAADEAGEWHLPLPASQAEAMAGAMLEAGKGGKLDEAFLSNAYAWMRKASDDKLDGMVVLLQRVLQLFASITLAEGTDDEVLEEVLRAETEDWHTLIKAKAESSETSEVAFMEALQKKMEATVLGQSTGSYTQRVQAEYLKELESRAKGVFKELVESE